jgi:hypothetical protein
VVLIRPNLDLNVNQDFFTFYFFLVLFVITHCIIKIKIMVNFFIKDHD